MTADVEAFAAAYDRLRDKIFDRASGHAPDFTEPSAAGEFLAVIEAFEKSELAAAKKTLADFTARYGNSRDAINDKVRSLGYRGNHLAGTIYEDFTRGIENIAKTRVATAAEARPGGRGQPAQGARLLPRRASSARKGLR